MNNKRFRLRVRYVKIGRLKYLSHLELIHTMERLVRRSGLEYVVSEGFSPHMKVGHGWALSVGVAGYDEYIDVWLKDYIPAQKALEALRCVSPIDLMPESAKYISENEPAITAAMLYLSYRATFEGAIDLEQALSSLLDADKIIIPARSAKKKDKHICLSDHIIQDPIASILTTESGLETTELFWDTHVTERGMLNPKAFIDALIKCLNTETRVLEIARTRQDDKCPVLNNS